LINADTHVGVMEWITSQSGGWVVSLASNWVIYWPSFHKTTKNLGINTSKNCPGMGSDEISMVVTLSWHFRHLHKTRWLASNALPNLLIHTSKMNDDFVLLCHGYSGGKKGRIFNLDVAI